MRRTYRTHSELTRAAIAAGLILSVAIAILGTMGADNGRALDQCQQTHSAATCTYVLR